MKKIKIKSRAMEKLIEQVFDKVFNKVFTKKRLSNPEKLKGEEIAKALTTIEESKEYERRCKKVSIALAKKGLSKQRGLWRKYYEKAKQNNLYGLASTYTEYEKERYRKIVIQNFKMIKTIPRSRIDMYEQKWSKQLQEQVLTGERSRGDFEKELRSHGATNAKVIARTETAKLQTAVIKERTTNLGSVCYFWVSSHDNRTRPSHKAMDGVVVFWRNKEEEKPNLDKMYGNAGEFPNCRCDVFPIFDESDLTKSNYKYYDYRVKKVNNVSKSQLIEWIKAGEIK